MHTDQIRISLRVGEIQETLDTHQNARNQRQLFLSGWWTEYKHGPRAICLTPGHLRDKMIRQIQNLFQKVYRCPLVLQEVSHHYPQTLDSHVRTLSPKTLISMTSHEDVKAVQRLLLQKHLWTRDPRNKYRSTRVYCQKVRTKREQRLQLPVNLIAQCMKCYMWKQALGKPGGHNYSWEQACQRFHAQMYMHSDGKSIRKRKTDETIALVLSDERNFPPTWDCFASDEVFKAIQEHWEENVPYYLPPQDINSVDNSVFDLTQLCLSPESKLYNQDTKLIEVKYENSWGQHVLAHYQHAKLYGLFQFIPIKEVTQKYRSRVVPRDLLQCSTRKRVRT